MKNNLIERATSFAADKHKTQYRKEGNLLYISHLVGVALILKRYDLPDKVIAGGLLHDTLEDTDTTKEEILENFGEEILNMILQVTNDDRFSWKAKKQKYLDAVLAGSEDAKAIALADKIHNMQSLLFNLQENGESVWDNFNASKTDKLWFEEECLKMFKSVFISKNFSEMTLEYENLIEDLLALSFTQTAQ